MGTPDTAAYGFWKSPITSDLVAGEAIRLAPPTLSDGLVYWSEGRPTEGGRNVIVRREADGTLHDLNPAPYNARTRVHEYGGGAYVIEGGTVYFSNDADQRIYRLEAGQPPAPVTPKGAWRYADAVVDRARGRLICVREDHTPTDREAVNTVVSLSLDGQTGVRVLASGNDFYSNPRLSPGGSRLAWLSWNHPNMPWDGTELWVAELGVEDLPNEPRLVAGGAEESIFQPEWSPDGELYFVSDRNGWWNLYRARNGAVEPVVEAEAEFGLPQWIFGQTTYAFESAGRIVCAYHRREGWRLASIELPDGKLTAIDTPFTEISGVHAAAGRVVFRGGSPAEPDSIIDLDLSSGERQIYRRSFEVHEEVTRYFSIPEPIEFPTDNSCTTHAFFYPPRNPDYQAVADELPPLMVVSHGGPTGSTSSTLSLSLQYWTSRGFAVLDVNYGGSSGYGRAYRERLREQWGIVDVADCVNGANHMVTQGCADAERLIIRGGSAGGYTTLAALAFRDVFRAGASYYGISDLEAMARETHKFESRYLDSMIGPYPERRDVYLKRSPLHYVDQLSAPVIFLQGSEDLVVPPNQAEMMLDALRKKGIPSAYLLFDGEQHGFRQAANIKRALDAELYFYATMLLRKGLRF